MPSKKTIVIALAVLLAAGYQFRDSDFVKTTMKRATDLAKLSRPEGIPSFDSGSPWMPASSGSAKLKVAQDLRKCKSKAEIIYINGECPAGSREISIGAGSVTVLPAAPLPVRASGDKTAMPPNVRELLLQGDDGRLLEKHMDEIIGK